MNNSSLLDKQFNCKLVLLGDSAVGKSCITVRFTKNLFYEFQEPTIGAAFATYKLELNDRKVKFEIWDTAGQERYRSLAPMYYRGAKFAVVVYDITSISSFTGAKKWVQEIKNNCGDNCIIALVGNKLDLEERRKVDTKEVEEYVKNKNISFIEASAKTGDNIFNIFETLAKKLTKDNYDNVDNDSLIITKKKVKRNICCY
jgi:small GTP-binding protein